MHAYPEVNPGDVWAAEGGLYCIIAVVRKDWFAPQIDLYDYLMIKETCTHVRGHLTIRNGPAGLWEKIA